MEGAWRSSELLVSLNDRGSVAGEQFLKLQVKLRSLKHAMEGKLISIVVTSPLMGEGKTSCAANLALALAQEPGRRVLLLDCDVRKPKIHSFLMSVPTGGLLDLLKGSATVKQVAVTMPGNCLDIITLASPGSTNGNRPQTLPIGKLDELLHDLVHRYEFIVCDAPPLLPTADATGLVDICDGTVLVVRAGVTPRPATSKALESINKKKLIGFVLNGVQESKMGRYYYQYYADAEKKK